MGAVEGSVVAMDALSLKFCWTSMSNRERNGAIDQVGRALFCNYWIGSLTMAQDDLAARSETRPLPAGLRLAAAAAIALYRRAGRKAQVDQVLKWWAERGGNLSAGEFNQREFETLYREMFGAVKISHSAQATSGTAGHPRRRQARLGQDAMEGVYRKGQP
jgi:hypothetical protein